ncbi:glycoside hydrolase family 16 protein [Hymenobacter sp. BT730]|uniref:glycoside hydrolase family 16 protein n=1 Tax=Hymenobacter sp. BT730 TaxID=3063332 RepID=UPI0026E10A09|nr:glycoside hydrolase family 16 protein [Hymenobacter sp. BT730]
MTVPFKITLRRLCIGASFSLALTALACTEEKAKVVPKPTPKPAEVNAEARDYAQYTELVWSDEFEAGVLDQSRWTYELGGGGWGNRELQAYTNSNENTYLTGGNLVIEAKQQQNGGNPYTSARLITKGKQSFTFGRIDVRAKLPKGKGVWPAIWMLGSNIDQVSWPACGEIDIMELRGSQPGKVLSTMHFGTSTADHRYKSSPEQVLASGTYADDFHIYSVVRSKDQIRVFLDGKQFFTFTPADGSPYPFNNPFFMILNLAIGGDFDGNPDASTQFPQRMTVDYVRFYQYK